MERSREKFSEFVSFCQSITGNDYEVLKLIQRRFNKCKPEYIASDGFRHLLKTTVKKIDSDSTNTFVHIKDFVTELKAYEHKEKKPNKRTLEITETSDIDEIPAVKKPKRVELINITNSRTSKPADCVIDEATDSRASEPADSVIDEATDGATELGIASDMDATSLFTEGVQTTTPDVSEDEKPKHSNKQHSSSRGSHGSHSSHGKGSERQINKLEKLLQELRDEIEKLESKELTLNDLGEDSENTYILVDKYKKKFVQVWKKLCEVKGREPTTGRTVERRFQFQGTKYPEVNRKIEKFINKFQAFPDYQDIRDIVIRCNNRHKLKFTKKRVDSLAQDAFTEVGDKLQKRRREDFQFCLDTNLAEKLQSRDDPAMYDKELRRKLESNKKIANSKIAQVIKKFADKQEDGDDTDSDDDDEDDEDEREADEHDREAADDEREADKADKEVGDELGQEAFDSKKFLLNTKVKERNRDILNRILNSEKTKLKSPNKFLVKQGVTSEDNYFNPKYSDDDIEPTGEVITISEYSQQLISPSKKNPLLAYVKIEPIDLTKSPLKLNNTSKVMPAKETTNNFICSSPLQLPCNSLLNSCALSPIVKLQKIQISKSTSFDPYDDEKPSTSYDPSSLYGSTPICHSQDKLKSKNKIKSASVKLNRVDKDCLISSQAESLSTCKQTPNSSSSQVKQSNLCDSSIKDSSIVILDSTVENGVDGSVSSNVLSETVEVVTGDSSGGNIDSLMHCNGSSQTDMPDKRSTTPEIADGKSRPYTSNRIVRSDSLDSSSRPDTPDGTSRPDTPDGTSRTDTPDGTSRTDTPNGIFRPDTSDGTSRPHTPDGTSSRPHTPDGTSSRPHTPDGTSQPNVNCSQKFEIYIDRAFDVSYNDEVVEIDDSDDESQSETAVSSEKNTGESETVVTSGKTSGESESETNGSSVKNNLESESSITCSITKRQIESETTVTCSKINEHNESNTKENGSDVCVVEMMEEESMNHKRDKVDNNDKIADNIVSSTSDNITDLICSSTVEDISNKTTRNKLSLKKKPKDNLCIVPSQLKINICENFKKKMEAAVVDTLSSKESESNGTSRSNSPVTSLTNTSQKYESYMDYKTRKGKVDNFDGDLQGQSNEDSERDTSCQIIDILDDPKEKQEDKVQSISTSVIIHDKSSDTHALHDITTGGIDIESGEISTGNQPTTSRECDTGNQPSTGEECDTGNQPSTGNHGNDTGNQLTIGNHDNDTEVSLEESILIDSIEIISSTQGPPKVPGSESDEPKVPGSEIDEPKVPGSKSDESKVPVSESDAPKVPGSEIDAPKVPGSESDEPKVPGSESDAPKVPGSEIDALKVPGSESEAPKVHGSESDTPKVPGSESDAPKVPESESEESKVPGSESDAPKVPGSESDEENILRCEFKNPDDIIRRALAKLQEPLPDSSVSSTREVSGNKDICEDIIKNALAKLHKPQSSKSKDDKQSTKHRVDRHSHDRGGSITKHSHDRGGSVTKHSHERGGSVTKHSHDRGGSITKHRHDRSDSVTITHITHAQDKHKSKKPKGTTKDRINSKYDKEHKGQTSSTNSNHKSVNRHLPDYDDDDVNIIEVIDDEIPKITSSSSGAIPSKPQTVKQRPCSRGPKLPKSPRFTCNDLAMNSIIKNVSSMVTLENSIENLRKQAQIDKFKLGNIPVKIPSIDGGNKLSKPFPGKVISSIRGNGTLPNKSKCLASVGLQSSVPLTSTPIISNVAKNIHKCLTNSVTVTKIKRNIFDSTTNNGNILPSPNVSCINADLNNVQGSSKSPVNRVTSNEPTSTRNDHSEEEVIGSSGQPAELGDPSVIILEDSD